MKTARGQPGYRANRSLRGGFLLVEALATMAISAFLLVALASVVSLMLRASDRAQRTSGDIEDISRTLSALTRQIERIAPVRWAGADAGFVFEGSDSRLVFARTVPLPDGTLEDRLVTLAANGRDLVESDVSLSPIARGMADITAIGTQAVVQQRFAIRFAYYARLETGQEALTDTWEDANQLPVAVRVTLTDADGVNRGMVRVSLLVDAEPGCAAPGKALCSFVAQDAATGQPPEPPVSQSVDADDALGWLRYGRRE